MKANPRFAISRRRLFTLTSVVAGGGLTLPTLACSKSEAPSDGLWGVWDAAFARARFVSLSHVLTPDAPIWKGFPRTTKFERDLGRDELPPTIALRKLAVISIVEKVDWLSSLQGWHRRLRQLYRNLSASVEPWRTPRRYAVGPATV